MSNKLKVSKCVVLEGKTRACYCGKCKVAGHPTPKKERKIKAWAIQQNDEYWEVFFNHTKKYVLNEAAIDKKGKVNAITISYKLK